VLWSAKLYRQPEAGGQLSPSSLASACAVMGPCASLSARPMAAAVLMTSDRLYPPKAKSATRMGAGTMTFSSQCKPRMMASPRRTMDLGGSWLLCLRHEASQMRSQGAVRALARAEAP
jgi:hypothetical protein